MRHSVRMRARSIALFVLLAGCGATPIPGVSGGHQNIDHWETAAELRFTYGERCGTGPFEVTFPAREIEWGRRITIEVHGQRSLPLHYSVEIEDPANLRTSRAFGDRPEEHARCRATDVAGSGAAIGASASSGAAGEVVRAEHGGELVPGVAVELAASPELVAYHGELPGHMTLGAAHAVFPRGKPYRFADEVNTWNWSVGQGMGEVRVRLWLIEPADFEGLVLRLRDQDLVPDISRDEYERTFAARVAAGGEYSEAYLAREAREAGARAARCEAMPGLEECAAMRRYRPTAPPPPPIAETRPAAPPTTPGVEVDWVPGFWSWDAISGREYVWVPGTYAIRVLPIPDEVAPPPPPPPPAAPPVAVTEERELAIAIPPPPDARQETIPPPPRVAGAVWVAGHFRLEGASWVWVPGVWQVPPSRGARPIAPAVRERDGLRIYVPGGWIEVR